MRLAITTSRPASSDLLLGEFTPTVLSSDPLTATVVAFSSICSLPLVGESAAREDDKCRQRLWRKGMGSPVVRARFRSWNQQYAAAAAHADKPVAMIELADTAAHIHRTDHNVHKDPQRYHQLSRHTSLSRPLRRTATVFRVALFTVTPEIYARLSPTSARQHGRKSSCAGRKSSTSTVAPHKYFLALRQPPAGALLEDIHAVPTSCVLFMSTEHTPVDAF